MHYPMVLAAAVKFDHGDQQDDNGKYPTSSGWLGYFLKEIGDN